MTTSPESREPGGRPLGRAGDPHGGTPEPDAGALVRVAASPTDWQAIRELSCLTGDGGNPIARDRWALFAEVWVGPYQRLVPDWTLVADAGGVVVGYLTGCPDTLAFRRARRLRVTAPLLGHLLVGRYGWGREVRRLLRRALDGRPDVSGRLLARLGSRLLEAYPAHLHVNVAAAHRGRGAGRALVARYCARLADAGITGVHLVCGAGPLGFYTRLGFEDLGCAEVRPGTWIHVLGRRLRPDRPDQ